MPPILRILAVFLATLSLPAPAAAETFALLIGVSDYESDAIPDLRGPRNDVRLMREALSSRGVERIRLLADGIEGAQAPTKAAILGALGEMAGEAGPGDLVIVHFSGHGTQEADRSGDETDGFDEIFLAADAAPAPPGGEIGGAVTDDEMGRVVAAIRGAGADVWVIIDSCHSGSGLRAIETRTATRRVDPVRLGATLEPPKDRETKRTEAQEGDLPGGLLAFYAARSSELAREMDVTGSGEWYGLFTAFLAARLQDPRPTSYRQLFQGVLADINAADVPGAARLQTPEWEGGLIDAPLPGSTEGTGALRFALSGERLSGGRLHGLTEGTVVTLFTEPAGGTPLGQAQVDTAGAAEAFVRPVSEGCSPDTRCPASGALPGAAFAEIARRALDPAVRIAPPVDMASGGALAAGSAPATALREAVVEAGVPLEMASEDWDIATLWDGAQLWFGPVTRVGTAPVGLAWDGTAPLAPLLRRIAGAETLARILSEVAAEASPLLPSPVTVEAGLAASDPARLAPAGSRLSPFRECARAAGTASAPLETGARLKQCDVMRTAARGTVPGARHVNRIYIDGQFCIHVDYELVEGARAPRRLGDDLMMCSECGDYSAAGVERMFVLVSEVVENAEPLNLEGIVENCAGGTTRGTGAAAALSFLQENAARPGTRGALTGFGGPEIWVESYRWTLVPKTELGTDFLSTEAN